MLEGYVKKDHLFVDERMGDSYPDIYIEPIVEEDSSIYTTYSGVLEGFACTLFHYVGKAGEGVDETSNLYKLVDLDLKAKKRRYYKVVLDHEEDISDDEIEEANEEGYQEA